jgi:hypothetical protein
MPNPCRPAATSGSPARKVDEVAVADLRPQDANDTRVTVIPYCSVYRESQSEVASWMSRRETNFGSLTGEGFEQDRGTHRTEAAFPQ